MTGLEVLGYLFTFVIGGGLFKLVTAFHETRKIKADARKVNVDIESARHKERVETLVVIIDNLRADNETLREERDDYKAERDEYWDRLKAAEARIESMQRELASLQAELSAFMDARPPTTKGS